MRYDEDYQVIVLEHAGTVYAYRSDDGRSQGLLLTLQMQGASVDVYRLSQTMWKMVYPGLRTTAKIKDYTRTTH